MIWNDYLMLNKIRLCNQKKKGKKKGEEEEVSLWRETPP
jgi:hypothetical protein